MSVTRALPVASALVILVFALLVFRRYRRRGGTHLLVWGIGLTMFGVGSFTEAYSTLAWDPTVFRLWYLGGAILNAAWLGQGTVYLLSGQRMPNLLLALIMGYAAAALLFIGLAAPLDIRPGYVAALIAFHGIIFTLPLNAATFDPTQTLSAQYREILPPGAVVRRFTPIFNIYGTISLVGGALYSAWLLWRKEIMPNRVLGNVLIATGALSLAFASSLVRLGLGDYLYVAELAGAVLMFAGFLLATVRAEPGRQAAYERAGSQA